MRLEQETFWVEDGAGPRLAAMATALAERRPGGVPVRVAVSQMMTGRFYCDVGILRGSPAGMREKMGSIFETRRRDYEEGGAFTAVMIVPTGIGAKLGGHAGDACPAAKLIASVCDRLITHPNVVNGSDLNEMPANGLYVEGSVISDLMMGTCGLIPVRSNRVLVVVDKHSSPRISDATVNAVSAARASLGLDCPAVVQLDPPVVMEAEYSESGIAAGGVVGLEGLCEVLDEYAGQYDAVALSSVIRVPYEHHAGYFKAGGEMVNPWGGVEAMLTHTISRTYNVPVAHAPMFESTEIADLDVGVVDPRMAAEAVSLCFLHCILKGLHTAPRITRDPGVFRGPGVIAAEDVSCLVIPDGCVGLPTLAAIEQGIPVIAVRANENLMKNVLSELPFAPGGLIAVESYIEAAGVIAAMRAGVSLESVRRPLEHTTVERVQTVPATCSG